MFIQLTCIELSDGLLLVFQEGIFLENSKGFFFLLVYKVKLAVYGERSCFRIFERFFLQCPVLFTIQDLGTRGFTLTLPY